MIIPFDIKHRDKIENGEYKVETYSGCPVIIYRWDYKDKYNTPILGSYIFEDGYEYAGGWDINGKFEAEASDFDLVLITDEEEPLTPLAELLSTYLKNDFEYFATKKWDEKKWNEVMNTQATELQRVAYLEKQKESLHISETCKENADSFTDVCKDVIVAIEKYLDWLTGYPDYAPKGKYSLRDMLYCLSILEKQKEPENVSASTMIPSCWAEEPSLQKEQKPTEPSDEELVRHPPIAYTYPSDASRDEQLKMALLALLNSDLIKVAGNKFTKQDLIDWVEKRQEQKPAEWSEDIIQKAVKEVGLTQHQIDWFKTNVFPPKQEWSEEDEKLLNKVEALLDDYCDFLEDGSSRFIPEVRETISRLKSLRPSWKPSKEQMEALESAVKLYKDTHFERFHIRIESLYEQLKSIY